MNNRHAGISNSRYWSFIGYFFLIFFFAGAVAYQNSKPFTLCFYWHFLKDFVFYLHAFFGMFHPTVSGLTKYITYVTSHTSVN